MAFGDTIVVTDSEEHAKDVLREYGPFEVGIDSADFNVMKVSGGWVVTYRHPDILTFVGDAEVGSEKPDFVIGMLGRQKRADAARKLEITKK